MENVVNINAVDEELEVEVTGLPPQDQLLRNEAEIINGLLAAANYKEDEDNIQAIEIKRNGKKFFEFRVRPLGEDELMAIRKLCVKKYNNPAGKGLPKIEGDVDLPVFRSRKIYAATVEEDKKLLWNNPQIKQSFKAKGIDILEGHEMVDKVLMAGEKDKISDIIDELSGYSADLTEYAKN